MGSFGKLQISYEDEDEDDNDDEEDSKKEELWKFLKWFG